MRVHLNETKADAMKTATVSHTEARPSQLPALASVGGRDCDKPFSMC